MFAVRARPRFSRERFELYLEDIVRRSINHLHRCFDDSPFPELKDPFAWDLAASSWKRSMELVFDPSKPLSSDPAQDLRMWRLLEWELLVLALRAKLFRIGNRPPYFAVRLEYRPHTIQRLVKNEQTRSSWINNRHNLETSVRDLFFQQGDLVQAQIAVQDLFLALQVSAEARREWSKAMASIAVYLKEGAIEWKRATFLLGKMEAQLLDDHAAIIDGDGGINGEWRDTGLLEKLKDPTIPSSKGIRAQKQRTSSEITRSYTGGSTVDTPI